LLPNEYYLVVGRSSIEKGLDVFLELWNMLNIKEKLVIVSPESLSIGNNNIIYLNNPSDNQLAYTYKNAKAIIVPSNWVEGFPRVIIETSSVNKPIIISDKIAITKLENLQNYITTFNLKSRESLKTAILTTKQFQDSSDYDFRSWYENNFSKEAYLKSIFDSYKS
jgi:glycosyltransferase involved in cell wall biosynthesis